jgi:16S rRNA (adenine1518-N6/adenine1519-N6)-dimethyltransferase
VRLNAPHRARKRFGQHFLIDRACIERILAAVDPHPGECVVEIGPGLGALTDGLLARLGRLDVIEIDRDLAKRLASTHGSSQLRLHVVDALKFDYSTLGGRLRIVGNLPYNISSPLLFRLTEFAAAIIDIHVMLQKEVVDRMCAAPGSRDYGRLSVMLGYHFFVERLFRVRAGSFRPPPKVESAFVRLCPRSPLTWPARDERLFARIVAAAFGQRRKTLRNALSTLVSEDALRRAGFDPQVRGETLTVEQFVSLANAVAD